MKQIIVIATMALAFLFASCDNANDLLEQYIKDGPIVYAAKIREMNTQSGYYRFRVNLYPAEDVNRSYCILSWNIREGLKDSLKIDYKTENFDTNKGCYFAVINIPQSMGIQGNLSINAQNVDTFGNRSLVETGSAYIYGSNYISSLINASVSFSPGTNKVVFEKRLGAVGNLLSYEQTDGTFTIEIFVTDDNYPLVNAKPGGTLRSKTRYLIVDTDIDTLEATEYLESKIP